MYNNSFFSNTAKTSTVFSLGFARHARTIHTLPYLLYYTTHHMSKEMLQGKLFELLNILKENKGVMHVVRAWCAARAKPRLLRSEPSQAVRA